MQCYVEINKYFKVRQQPVFSLRWCLGRRTKLPKRNTAVLRFKDTHRKEKNTIFPATREIKFFFTRWSRKKSIILRNYCKYYYCKIYYLLRYTSLPFTNHQDPFVNIENF